jgi:CDP-diacylglycerol--glycerol-3-phosphate 3-phosphatidyltransferase
MMDIRKFAASKITGPLIPFLSKTGLTPDILTWTGLFVIIIAAAMVATNYLLVGGLLVLLSGLFDILDGALARFTKKITRFGALLDSTFDRLSEALLLIGILILYINGEHALEILLIFVVMTGSFLISYIRARAEGLGIECQTGLFTRAERVIILALGLMINQIVITLIILAVFTSVTVVQRLVHAWQQLRKQGHNN